MYQSDLEHPQKTLQDKLTQLYTLNRDKAIDLSFRPPYLQLLEALGNPHLNLPPVIHVAGTNGKGSTIAMLRAVLEEAGYKVHAYTSPHLIRFNERIVLAGREIEDGPLEALIDEALALNDGRDLTFFEITTAIAFAAFARTPADICLLEVGMGGRLDCTNVIQAPLASVISAIGLDHQEYLGDTIGEIALEKAGIMKPGSPCIIAPQSADVMDVFEEIAKTQNAVLLDCRVGSDEPPRNDGMALIGAHQKNNLATALKTLDVIRKDFPVQNEHIQNGLKNVRWPARLQKLPPQAFGLTDGFELYLDGGHNADAGAALAHQCAAWQEQDGTPLFVVLGMMDGKDTAAFTAPLLPHVDGLYLVNIEGEPKSQSAEALQVVLPEGRVCQTYREALADIAKNHENGRILICGSLYLAGHVLKALQK